MTEELTELEKVRIIAVDYRYWVPKKLIEAALESGIFINLNRNRPYSYERVYGMLREGKDWVTEKLKKYAEENPRN